MLMQASRLQVVNKRFAQRLHHSEDVYHHISAIQGHIHLVQTAENIRWHAIHAQAG